MKTPDPSAEMAQLAGGLIHEIKNHISTLGLNLELLAEDFQKPKTPRDRKVHDRIARLQNECRRLKELSEDFLRFARLRELNVHSESILEIINEMVDFFGPTARVARIEIKTFLPSSLPPVRLDRELFKQALLNLMLNAEQAMPEGGELTLLARAEDHSVRLDVIDSGIGMSAESLARCFEPFHTTKPNGSGLGLPTTRRIVQMHGGRIDVQSEPGKGTQFTIWLPAA
jgi:two-component system, NtrC family, sensor histidine kinase HydH